MLSKCPGNQMLGDFWPEGSNEGHETRTLLNKNDPADQTEVWDRTWNGGRKKFLQVVMVTISIANSKCWKVLFALHYAEVLSTSSVICLGSTGAEAGFFGTGGGLGGLFGRTLSTSSWGISNCNMPITHWVTQMRQMINSHQRKK